MVDTDRGGLFVVKFRGAGQGPKVLIAELIVGLLAKAAGLPAPELAIIDILPAFGRSEPDPEIQEILGRSHGVNVGLRYLDGAFNFDASAAGEYVSSDLATRLVWFDAFVTNPIARIATRTSSSGSAVRGSSITARHSTPIMTGRQSTPRAPRRHSR